MNRPKGQRQERSRPLMLLVGFMWCVGTVTASGDPQRFDYKVLATNRTSTMEKEMNRAAALGFRLAAVMGGETSFGGSEVVVIMQKGRQGASGSYQYRLLATNRTSTMQKEMNQAAGEGFGYAGQTVFETTFGGKETVVIMERHGDGETRYEYKLLATNRTSTMQKELTQEGENGFKLAGMTVSRTTFGGEELVSILQRPVR
ncbi:MAG: hypothetical protein OXG96_04935 [Acidobacteria bacterium]|nr:hypothetical protein [Acidobacteriota bacterium]